MSKIKKTSVEVDLQLFLEFKKIASMRHQFDRGYTRKAWENALTLYVTCMPLVVPIVDDDPEKLIDMYGNNNFGAFMTDVIDLGMVKWLKLFDD